MKNSTIAGNLASTGTKGTGAEDKICNIYDMASNAQELTTESYVSNVEVCACRGGECSAFSQTTSSYFGMSYNWEISDIAGFRQILYCSTES